MSDLNKTNENAWLEIKKFEAQDDTEKIYLSLYGESKQCYWLDSNRGLKHEPKRHTFMGAFETAEDRIVYSTSDSNTVKVVSQDGEKMLPMSLFDYLKQTLNKYSHLKDIDHGLPFSFKTGFVGYMGYELKKDMGFLTTHEADIPNSVFFFSTRTVVYDHNEKMMYLIALTTDETKEATMSWFETVESKINENLSFPEPYIEKVEGQISFSLSQDHEEYIENIKRCKEKIVDGESYEICLTNRIHTDLNLEPQNLYRFLRRNNPAPYATFLKFDDFSILSSSPEQFLKIKQDGWVSTKPIKGTIEKSADPAVDAENIKHLKTNEKDRAENLMIVDLLRNDLGKVCEIGSVSVPILMDIESYATLHQLVSTVIGKLKEDLTIVDCIEAVFPGGSITGAPKIRTMEIIDEFENEARGVYTGGIGFLSVDNIAEMNIAIRTATVTKKGISIGVGGAITFLSDEESEFKEIIVKGYPLIKTIVSACKETFSDNHYVFSNSEEKYVKL